MVDRLYESRSRNNLQKSNSFKDGSRKVRNNHITKAINQTVNRLRNFQHTNLSLSDHVQRLTNELERTKQAINEIYFMMDETYKPELRFSEGGVRDSIETSYNRNVYCAITMGEMKPNSRFHRKNSNSTIGENKRGANRGLTATQLQDLIERLTKPKPQNKTCHTNCTEELVESGRVNRTKTRKINAIGCIKSPSETRKLHNKGSIIIKRKRADAKPGIKHSASSLITWQDTLRVKRKFENVIAPTVPKKTLTPTEEFKLIEKLTKGASEKAPDRRRVPTEAEKRFGIVCSLMWTGY
ncbi:uncharacterized protein LOC113475781 [Ciona intestinalis]